MKNIVNKFKQLSTKDKILSIILCIMIILFIHDIMKPIINNDNSSSHKKESEEQEVIKKDDPEPVNNEVKNTVNVKIEFGDDIKLTASEEYSDEAKYYSNMNDEISLLGEDVYKTTIFDSYNMDIERVLDNIFSNYIYINDYEYGAGDLLDEKYYNKKENIIDLINKYKSNDSFDLEKVSELISHYNTNLKKLYDSANEGIDPESDEYVKPNTENYYAFNNNLAYFYEKNIDESKERKFTEKIVKKYLEDYIGSYTYDGITNYYVTLYPVYLNDKFITYYIAYDVAYSQEASDTNIKKEYKKVKDEFIKKAELYPNSYILDQYDELSVYKEYSNNKYECYEDDCIKVTLNQTFKWSSSYGYIFTNNNDSDINLYDTFSVLDLEKNKEYDIYSYVKKHYDDIANGKIKAKNILKNIIKESK